MLYFNCSWWRVTCQFFVEKSRLLKHYLSRLRGFTFLDTCIITICSTSWILCFYTHTCTQRYYNYSTNSVKQNMICNFCSLLFSENLIKWVYLGFKYLRNLFSPWVWGLIALLYSMCCCASFLTIIWYCTLTQNQSIQSISCLIYLKI